MSEPVTASPRATIGLAVLASALVALTALVNVRAGLFALAGLCAAVAVVRFWLPERAPLRVRRRGVDAAILFVFAVVLALLASTIELRD